ncbi:MAG: dihydroorotate dehydrogenase [Piscirickettsiaceae bacterium CG_4_9_14_3_um_filter_43_564]|nr:dihydroorotate dehydrogenase [Thiomicrospira sp.]OIP95759.1 MAG: dihydroorotate dehydrogenase B catalytic subunit [Thiomicrospira sp. CG2_30_44_34]PIQ06077.1 MAG: dihydroorotate dehydrogenase B catalytic subunit [Piscirickettsiaceae bacterium CG18_big_fil_WC_8_21_14_2_50_44_103]PIU38190.1 MAG: dihydroorotate dehydrogenase [Piscirickettsiaceae bacterium CG07_land_8_20_14_0_80_44_28]PIW57736.1 MAG: dihydroorotate dehydrogenase [Piscirickettsiaceae bacterium CG12_big_fil_rev_8_21_14_0_65_44_934
MVDLSVQLGSLTFRNPVAMASGNAGYGFEYQSVSGFSNRDVGAIFLKGTTLEPKLGNKPERVMETPSGLLNSIGLQNPGAHAVIKDYLPKCDLSQSQFIINVSGATIEEYAEVVRLFDQTDLPAIEVNISCPNVKKGGAAFGNDPDMAAQVVEACRKNTTKPLIVKLSPNQTDIAEGARRVIEAGADMLSAVNTLMGMQIDIHTARPTLGNNQGGLSGPAIKPVALLKVHQIYQVAKQHQIPIIGLGGISCADDAIEFLLAGASMVAVGTALAKDPLLVKKINKGIARYMQRYGYQSVAEITGKLTLNTDTVLCG